MSADSLMMERKAAQATRRPEPAGGTKSILFVVHEDDGLESRLQSALALARSCSAQLQLLHVIPVEAFTVVDTYGGAFVSGEIIEALQGEADKTRKRIEQHLELEDVSWNYEISTSVMLPELLQRAAFADLVVMGRHPHWHEFSRTGPGLLGAFISRTRTPLVIPSEKRGSFDPFGKALIAWNGSIEAANAVRASIGLLKMASEVRVVRYCEEKELSLGDERLMEYLSRHDIHAEIETHLPKKDIGEDLVDRCARTKSEYLVMGAYSHSRAGEFLFGGVTRALLKECPMSLVIAH